ncbi:unnamed protein product [Ascophyllum nodosum]
MCKATQAMVMPNHSHGRRRPCTPCTPCKVGEANCSKTATVTVDDEGSEDHFPPPSMSPKLLRSSDAEAPHHLSSPVSNTFKASFFRKKGPAPQFVASARGDTEVLSLWLRAGGDPDARDDEDWTILQHASMNGRLDCVQLLLRHGARANVACSGARHTVLHVAAANRHRGVVECLVEAGASIEAQNAHGNTPLHSAAATGTLEVMTYLLHRSADPDAVNSLGETADRVSGAGPEALELIEEARRRKRARIAQRQALLHLHKLWNSGRAEPKTTIPRAAERPAGSSETRETLSRAEGGCVDSEHNTDPRLLESAVAGVAALPEELFRRLVTFCSI